MRRFLTISIGLVCAATTMGCEDGPNQTGPAPSGAAVNWNNGGPDAAISDPGMQAFDAGGGGTNAVNVCSAPQQNAAWAKAFAAPVVPPFQMGGVDLSNGGTFLPVKLEDVIHGSNGQTQLCQGQPAGACSASGEGIGYSWGPSGQLYTCYDPASHALTFFTIFNGYSGTGTYKLPKTYLGVDVPAAVDQAGNHVDLNYVWEVGKPITENGKTLDMGWTARGAASKPLNKLYLGQLATFAPSLIAATTGGLNELTDASYDCHVVGKCRTSANPDGSGGNFGCRPTALYADFALSNLESSNLDTASSPSDIYMYPAKYEPYSFAPYDISLDNMAKISTAGDPTLTLNGQPIYGPFAPAGVLSPAGAPETPFCTIFMGQTFGQLLKNCVNVTGTAAVDQTSVAKLLGTQAHSNEWYTFSINGINENFSGDTKELTQNGLPGVLQDAPPGKTVTPNSDDVATDFFDDIRAYGQPLNEMRGDSLVAKAAVTALDRWEDANFLGQDQHGSATVTGYYRQLTYNDLLAQNLAAFNIPAAPLQTCWVDSTTQSPATWVPPAGCTGFEQMVTVAIPSKGMTCVAPDPDPSDPDPTGAGCGEFAPVTPTGFDYNDLGVGNYGLFFGGIATMFRPGDPEIDFLADPRHPENGSLWDALNGGAYNLCQSSLNQVIAVMGHGNINNVPPAARDWRYYFKFWAQAWVKYMLNRASDPTWAQLYADDLSASPTMHQVNQDALFFDLENGLDRFEYVDRSHAAQLGAPLDMSYDVLINSSNVQDNNFFQRLSRAESALYVSELGAAELPGHDEGRRSGQQREREHHGPLRVPRDPRCIRRTGGGGCDGQPHPRRERRLVLLHPRRSELRRGGSSPRPRRRPGPSALHELPRDLGSDGLRQGPAAHDHPDAPLHPERADHAPELRQSVRHHVGDHSADEHHRPVDPSAADQRLRDPDQRPAHAVRPDRLARLQRRHDHDEHRLHRPVRQDGQRHGRGHRGHRDAGLPRLSLPLHLRPRHPPRQDVHADARHHQLARATPGRPVGLQHLRQVQPLQQLPGLRHVDQKRRADEHQPGCGRRSWPRRRRHTL